MKFLLFETTVYGHYLEYIHHLYEGMSQYPDDELILVLPPEFEMEKDKYEWTPSENIHIISITTGELNGINDSGAISAIWKRARLLRKYAIQNKPDVVFLISLASYMPFLPLLLSRETRIYGILYKFYVYQWRELSLAKKIAHVLLFYFYKYRKNIRGIFVLNDQSSTAYFNRRYKTDKFLYLPDPFNHTPYGGKDLRKNYNIYDEEYVFLHFGALTGRKGTIEILDAIELMTPDEREGKVFVFAGQISPSISNGFYERVNRLKQTCKIIIHEGFCSNEMLTDLCVTSDCLLCPYKLTDLSSGVLGYAATYKKPVIGPSGGLIGKLIKRYHLGWTINIVTPYSIKDAICNVSKIEIKTSYVDHIRVENFVKTIYDLMFREQ